MSSKKTQSKVKETATKFRLLQCIRLLGDLSIHLSGENKVMFKTKDDESYFTYYGVTLSGDQGCVKPLDNAPCALDELKKLFSRFEPWMYQNDEQQECYITDEFKDWINCKVPEMIHNHFTDECTETVICEYIPKGEIDPIAIVTVSALTNPYVVSMYEDLEEGDVKYKGEIESVAAGDAELKYALTVKHKRKEDLVEVDLANPSIMVGIVDIEKAKHLYMDKINCPVLTPVLLHGKKRGLIITDVTRAEK